MNAARALSQEQVEFLLQLLAAPELRIPMALCRIAADTKDVLQEQQTEFLTSAGAQLP